ncbi:MAG: pantoate--beta-alanine ligase [Gammaproteobacteria bacterium]|nr:pantoate--beta-alanine ligase [Gammaproteobacteria bacterium]
MNIVTTLNDWQCIRKKLIAKTIGFVPTMGHLHAGHLQLCQQSQAENDITVVSIFINPTQFNVANDFEKYPRTIEKDKQLLLSQQIDYIFLPDVTAMYPDNYEIQIAEINLSKELEGEHRPGHFNGMLTIVLKLLNLVQATRAYFGEKDYQQLCLIKKMAAALFIPTEIIACATVRAEDGLALSSRNSRLTAEQRQKAADFPRLLQSTLSPEEIVIELQQLGFKVDYVVDKWQRRLGAVWLEDVRLIDNIPLEIL